MSQQVYADTEAFTTRWDDEIESAVHTWNQYVDGESFRDGCEAMLDLGRERGSNTILIDHRDMKLVDREDQAYIVEEWIPRAVEDVGMKHHMVVHQESTLAELNLDDVIQIDGIDYNADMTSDWAEAREWIAEK